METTLVQSIKLAIVADTGLSKDALHVYVGLTVQFVAALVSRKTLRSAAPWLAVFALALVGELIDMRDDLVTSGHWRWGASLYDIVNTIFWPTVILALARRRILFGEVGG